MDKLKLYIAVLDDVPDFIVPTLVAHSVLGAHIQFTLNYQLSHDPECPSSLYYEWLNRSFSKCVVRVNRKEFGKISDLPNIYRGHENKTLDGEKSCIVVSPMREYPNVIKFAKLWAPKQNESSSID